MAARAISSGTISFGLVSIPVKVYTAISSKQVRFNTLDGTFKYGEAPTADLSIEVSIPIESVDTNASRSDLKLSTNRSG